MIEQVCKRAGGAADRKQVAAHKVQTAECEWLIVEAPKADELDALAETFDLKRGNLDDAMDDDEVPRLDHDAQHGYIYVRAPLIHTDGSTTTSPLLLIIGGGSLITVFKHRPAFIDDILSTESRVSTHSTQLTMLHILAQVFAAYDVYIKGQSQTIKQIIAKMRKRSLANEDFLQFVMLDDQINNFLSALTPIDPMIKRLMTSHNLKLTDSEHDQLEDIMLAVEQSINICHGNASRITSIREAYSTLSNNVLNRTMKTLTAATLLIAAPNVIFGMYGMNVNLPFQWNGPWGMAFALSLAVVLIILIALWARRKKLF